MYNLLDPMGFQLPSGSAKGEFEISTLKEIKIQNFSSQSNNPASEFVHLLEEKFVFCTEEAQWSEPLFELVVHPKGHISDTKDFVSVMIRKFWFSPYFVPKMTADILRCTVSVLDINGRKRFPQSFVKEGFLASGWGLDVFNADDVGLEKFVRRTTLTDEADELLPEDVLTVLYEVFFKFCIGEAWVVLDPFKEGVEIPMTPLPDHLIYFRSIICMMENALDEINYVLQMIDTVKKAVLRHSFSGEIITPGSDEWERCFASMYQFMGERQTKLRVCNDGWVNRDKMEELSDVHLVASILCSEIERRCDRTVQLAKVKRLLFKLMSNNDLNDLENEIDNMSSATMEMFSMHRSFWLRLHQGEAIESPVLIVFAEHFLSHLSQIMRQLPRRLCIVTSLSDYSLFWSPKSNMVLRETHSKETQTTKGNVYQEKVAVENFELEVNGNEMQNRVETGQLRISSTKKVERACSCNVEASSDHNIETKTCELKQMESIEKNTIKTRNEKDLELLNEEMQNQVVDNEEERNASIANATHDDETVGNQNEALRIEKERNLIKLVEKETVVENEEERNDSVTNVAHDDEIVGNHNKALRNEKERNLIKLMEKEIVENEEERNDSVANVAHDDETVGNQNEALRNEKERNFIKLVEKEIAGFQTEVKATHEELENSNESDEQEAEDLWQLISQPRDCNGHLCQANSLMVEGCLLKASSLVFHQMMEAHMQEKSKRQIRMDMEFETLKLFVNYLKTGKLADSDGYDWRLLYKVAHLYDVQRLIELCSQQIAQNITLEDALLLKKFAEHYEDDQLREKVEKFVEESNSLWEKWKIPATFISTSPITSSASCGSTGDRIESLTQLYTFYQ